MRNFLKIRKEQFDSLRKLRKKKFISPKKEALDFLFSQCDQCMQSFTVKEKENNYFTCPYCGKHFAISVRERMHRLLDTDYEILQAPQTLKNPLHFPGYEKKLGKMTKETGLSDAVVCVRGKILTHPAIVCLMDNQFFMGSMGCAVGEQIAHAFEVALKESLPIIVFSTSGGARMQEGMYSLMQMAKTSAAIKKHSDAGLLYISYLTHPTTGGVTASFASLGDIILAEPGALIGFAGPRVIEQTMKKGLPPGFQTAEFLLEKGFIDHIVPRNKMRETLAFLLDFHRKRGEE